MKHLIERYRWHRDKARRIKELEKIIMAQQDDIDALAARIVAAEQKAAALETKSVNDDKTIAALNAQIAAIPAPAAPLDLSGVTTAVSGLEAALTPPATT